MIRWRVDILIYFFTMEFYQIVAQKLKKDGILIVQSGAASIVENDVFTGICNTLSKVFPHVFPYVTYIPSYALQWVCNGDA